jgi:hypothetical protein
MKNRPMRDNGLRANPETGTGFTLKREEDPLSRWSAGLLASSSAVRDPFDFVRAAHFAHRMTQGAINPNYPSGKPPNMRG